MQVCSADWDRPAAGWLAIRSASCHVRQMTLQYETSDVSYGVVMAAPVTEAAIAKIRELIIAGELRPESRLPPEAELADRLGVSRGSAREAVRALVTARVLDVRRGDGTYVTSLRPQLLLEGIGFAVDMMRDDSALELRRTNCS